MQMTVGPCDRLTAVAFSWTVNRKQALDRTAESAGTLGALLYADRSASPIPEADWVALVRGTAAGDQRALRALYERTHRLVFTLAMRISNGRESAEEITLDVFRDVWRRSAEYDPDGGSVVGWIMNQARSRAIDRVRFEQRKKRNAPDATEREAEPVDGPAEAMEARRRRSLVRDALTTLTPDERQAIETAFFCELTYAETAVRLSEPVGTVKTRIRSALAKLRKLLETVGDAA
jgi:RNA polymerase sigma-70 factor (ECF subfamily)